MGTILARARAAHNANLESSPPAAAVEPLEELAARHHRFAIVVDASSSRRDAKATRARIVLLLLELRCPLAGTPRKRWYVPGAVARVGWRGLSDRWLKRFGEQAPSERALRGHLAQLESACILQRAPGDYLPVRRELVAAGKRPRYPDTFHILAGEAESEWWADAGERILENHPDAKTNPRRWREVLGDWRNWIGQPGLPFPRGDGSAEANVPRGTPCRPTPPTEKQLAARVVAAAGARGPLGVISALHRAGVALEARAASQAARDHARLAGATAMLGAAIARGPKISNPAGWLLRAFRHAKPAELEAAANAAGLSGTKKGQSSPAGTAGNRPGSPQEDSQCESKTPPAEMQPASNSAKQLTLPMIFPAPSFRSLID